MFFRTALPGALVACHMEKGVMLIHDEVGVNCKNGATTDITILVPNIWAKGCMLDICAYVIELDYPSLTEEGHGILLLDYPSLTEEGHDILLLNYPSLTEEGHGILLLDYPSLTEEGHGILLLDYPSLTVEGHDILLLDYPSLTGEGHDILLLDYPSLTEEGHGILLFTTVLIISCNGAALSIVTNYSHW